MAKYSYLRFKMPKRAVILKRRFRTALSRGASTLRNIKSDSRQLSREIKRLSIKHGISQRSIKILDVSKKQGYTLYRVKRRRR